MDTEEERWGKGRKDHQVLALDNYMVGDKSLTTMCKRMSRIGKGEGFDSKKFILGPDEFKVSSDHKIEMFNRQLGI